MFSYREERRVFAVISVIIVAALVALLQLSSARSGVASPLSALIGSIAAAFEDVVGPATLGVHGALGNLVQTPHLMRENGALHAELSRLAVENAQLRERAAAAEQAAKLQPLQSTYAHAIEARVVGFPPENESQSVTIDRGSRNGLGRDDGVVNGDGVVGRIYEASPFASKVLLITDYTSSVPAMIEPGRWWGVAKGNLTSLRVEYISQDANIAVGDLVVTGEARSFHSGEPLGTIVRIDRTPAGLYQTAIVKPSADLSAVDRVLVLPK